MTSSWAASWRVLFDDLISVSSANTMRLHAYPVRGVIISRSHWLLSGSFLFDNQNSGLEKNSLNYMTAGRKNHLSFCVDLGCDYIYFIS